MDPDPIHQHSPSPIHRSAPSVPTRLHPLLKADCGSQFAHGMSRAGPFVSGEKCRSLHVVHGFSLTECGARRMAGVARAASVTVHRGRHACSVACYAPPTAADLVDVRSGLARGSMCGGGSPGAGVSAAGRTLRSTSGTLARTMLEVARVCAHCPLGLPSPRSQRRRLDRLAALQGNYLTAATAWFDDLVGALHRGNHDATAHACCLWAVARVPHRALVVRSSLDPSIRRLQRELPKADRPPSGKTDWRPSSSPNASAVVISAPECRIEWVNQGFEL